MSVTTTISNDFQHSGPREKIDGIVIHSMAKYFNRDLLLQSPYNIPPELVETLDEVVFAPDFLEFVGKHAKQGWLKGSADFFVERHGIGYRWGYDKQTWHAGRSQWGNWINLNKNFAGIECLVGREPFEHYGHFISEINNNKDLFTDQMYETLANECNELIEKHGILHDNVVTHKMVAGDHVRGKGKGKQDLGEAFDWEYFKSLLHGA
jgi:N-acetyl-anhydromuramyl-L-alanine amidase AmpD